MSKLKIAEQKKAKKIKPTNFFSINPKFCQKSVYAVTSFNKLAQLSPLYENCTEATKKQTVIKRKKNNVKLLKNCTFCHKKRVDGFNSELRLIVNDKNGLLEQKFVKIYALLKFKKLQNNLAIDADYIKLGFDGFAAAKFQQKNLENTLNYVWENHGEITNEILKQEDKQKLFKKAKAKYFTELYLQQLIDLESSLQKNYISTKSCCGELYQNGYKITSKYCKQRWCNVCNRIRTAQLINGYIPQLQAFDKPAFLTLTLKNCHRLQLPYNLRLMQKIWRYIYKKIAKDLKLKKRKYPHITELKGVKKLECTYNFTHDNYHPHFHFVFSNYDTAEFVKNEWINYFHRQGDFVTVDVRAQKNILIDKSNPDNFLKSLQELFKYFTKVVSKTNEFETQTKQKKKSIWFETEKKKKEIICIPALDVIFQSMYGKRVYEPFGVKAIKEDINELISEKYSHLIYQTKTWTWSGEDWINGNENLADFKNLGQFDKLVKQIIAY